MRPLPDLEEEFLLNAVCALVFALSQKIVLSACWCAPSSRRLSAVRCWCASSLPEDCCVRFSAVHCWCARLLVKAKASDCCVRLNIIVFSKDFYLLLPSYLAVDCCSNCCPVDCTHFSSKHFEFGSLLFEK
jgi:hypothetical protein